MAVRIRELEVQRGENRVLPGISLDVRRGIVTGLLGPSGAGKTTLMRAVVGVQIVKGGDVEVLGQPAGSPGLRRTVGYMTQEPAVYADLSVRENLAYFARVLGVPRGRVDETIERVGLAEMSGRLVRRLSGGERARVSLATALVHDPDVLVLDEPTVGLDPVLRRDLWDFFHSLAASGTTLLVSSHVMDEAERCDRLVLLRDGVILADLEPEELLRRTEAPDLASAFLRLVEDRTG